MVTSCSQCESWILLRHVETEKNIRRGIGDSQTKATGKGILQLNSVVGLLSRLKGQQNVIIYHGDRGHVMATVDALAGELGCKAVFDARISRIGLGSLDGAVEGSISGDLASLKLLDDWRSGAIPICDLAIPGIEPFESFTSRISEFLFDLDESVGQPIIVVSQSVYICFINLIRGNSLASIYWNYTPATSEVTVFRRVNGRLECLELGIVPLEQIGARDA